MKHSHRAYEVVKRVLDVVGAAILLVLSSPILLVVAVLVRAKLGPPIIFRQQRPGQDGKLFTVYKFRSMTTPSSESGGIDVVATDEARLTSFGMKLRSTSLDELPELVNVLLGHMSIVGPRPLLPEYLGRYNDAQARRHEVRPGLTGWAQVNGRNAVSWKDRLAMDVWYVDRRSLVLDARILLMTVAAVFRRRGISGAGTVTMLPFEGDGNRNASEERS